MPVPFLGRAIRCRHSAVDEERGGRDIARHIDCKEPTININKGGTFKPMKLSRHPLLGGNCH